MPRIPRNLILDNDYQTHKIWKGLNGQWHLEKNSEKIAYLDFLNQEIIKQPNELNAFDLMSNHAHELYYIVDREKFSDLMRVHHSRYGMYFNRKRGRTGRIIDDRPKTCMIEDDEYSMRATFYIHANPVRAGMVKDAADYKWSTHRLYAFGERDEFNKNVKFPGWYMELGDSWENRQRRYRQLFDLYLKEEGLIKQEFLKNNFFGSLAWMADRSNIISDWQKSSLSQSPP
jgi:putative transposase